MNEENLIKNILLIIFSYVCIDNEKQLDAVEDKNVPPPSNECDKRWGIVNLCITVGSSL